MQVSPVTVETGAVVTGANSYASVTELRQYALDQAYDAVPDDEGAAATLLYRAMDYIEIREPRFQGLRYTTAYNRAVSIAQRVAAQSLCWPRYGVRIASRPVGIDEIPPELKRAQLELACLISSGVDLLVNVTRDRSLKRDTKGPLTKEWFSAQESGSAQPTLVFAEGMLSLLYSATGSALLTTVRV